MGRRHRRANPFVRHVRLHYWMMDSAAWRHMRPIARALLVQLYSLFNGMNNGDLFLSVRDAAQALNVTANTAMKAFGELETHGFIRARQRGAFTLKIRHATTWILTEFPHGTELPTKDFMRWAPPAGKENTVSKIQTDGMKNSDRGGKRRAA